MIQIAWPLIINNNNNNNNNDDDDDDATECIASMLSSRDD
jgi:hypothetical protein